MVEMNIFAFPSVSKVRVFYLVPIKEGTLFDFVLFLTSDCEHIGVIKKSEARSGERVGEYSLPDEGFAEFCKEQINITECLQPLKKVVAGIVLKN